MDDHVGVVGESEFGFLGMEQMVRVNAVNHVDPWAGIAQRVRQTVDLHRVATEAVRRIEGGQVQELSGRLIARPPPAGLPTSVAAASQVSRRAAEAQLAHLSPQGLRPEHSGRADVRSARRAGSTYRPPPPSSSGSGLAVVAITRTAAGSRLDGGQAEALPSTKAAPGPLRDSRGQPVLHPEYPVKRTRLARPSARSASAGHRNHCGRSRPEVLPHHDQTHVRELPARPARQTRPPAYPGSCAGRSRHVDDRPTLGADPQACQARRRGRPIERLKDRIAGLADDEDALRSDLVAFRDAAPRKLGDGDDGVRLPARQRRPSPSTAAPLPDSAA